MISGVISKTTIVIAHIRGLTILITTHEPPSRFWGQVTPATCSPFNAPFRNPGTTADDINPALPMIRNIPQFP